MQTEHWALLVSINALIASIGIPMWQWRESTARLIATKRTSMHELIWILKRYGARMEPEQRTNPEAMVPRMRSHHDDLEKLHTEWSDYNDGASLSEIKAAFSDVDLAYSKTGSPRPRLGTSVSAP